MPNVGRAWRTESSNDEPLVEKSRWSTLWNNVRHDGSGRTFTPSLRITFSAHEREIEIGTVKSLRQFDDVTTSPCGRPRHRRHVE
jgi:hypothetical protein